MQKIMFIVCFLCFSFLYANNSGKFLVIDNNTYEKIKTLNILNGGIKQEYIVSSRKLSIDSIKRYYPEYFLYSGPICYNINNTKDSKKYTKKEDILKEINKIKLLQMLGQSKNSNANNINDKLIKSVGIICQQTVLFRGKVYTKGNKIGNFMIKSIDYKNARLSLEEK